MHVGFSQRLSVPVCQAGECLLCEARLYGGLTAEQACNIRGLLAKHEYKPHEVLFREGDPSTHLFVLRQGLLKLTSLGPHFPLSEA